jgi:hypothetical protein
VLVALETLKKSGPRALSKGVEEWNTENGLVLYRGLVYVPKDDELRRDIVKAHHDPIAAGHPGQSRTLEMVSRNYWWPSMTKFINEYVSTCDTCNRTRVSHRKPQGLLQPNEIPEGPWQIVTTDMIVELPYSDGFNAILIVVDRFTKMARFIPTITELGAADMTGLYIENVWRLFGPPKQVISDRGPQFNSRFLKSIYQQTGTDVSVSTAYHPQTDGQTERTNQEIEQFVRVYTSWRQDDWARLIPMAEFAYNSKVHSATGYTPFHLMYGYTPEFNISINPYPTVPSAQDRLELIKECQEDAKAALEMTADRMKRFYDKHVDEAPIFEVGSKVWLDTKNLDQRRPSKKLSHKRAGPYEVLERIGDLNYKLKLPHQMKIHPVFHVNLLSGHKESTIPGRIFAKPPPIEIDGEQEYEVEEVLNSRIYRNYRQDYLIKWKGYGHQDNTWEPLKNVKNSSELINKFHEKYPEAPRMNVRATITVTENI